MPCSQMISMNISPPRDTDERNVASAPAVKARILNRPSSNIGCATRSSTNTKATSSATPAAEPPSTNGDRQPIGSPPYGRMPYVMPIITRTSPTREGEVARPVDRARATHADLAQLAVRPDRPEDARRDGDEEDQPPVDRREQTAEHEADERAADADDVRDPEREPALVRRERVGEDRARVREQERGADALEDAEDDQPVGAGGGRAASRRRGSARRPCR